MNEFFRAALALPLPVVVVERYDRPVSREVFNSDEAYQHHLDRFYARPLNERRISSEVRLTNVSSTNWR